MAKNSSKRRRAHSQRRQFNPRRRLSAIELLEERRLLASDYAVGAASAATFGNFDHDFSVTGNDFLVWQRSLGTAATRADANSDGAVNAADLTVWRQNFSTIVLRPDAAINATLGDFDGDLTISGNDFLAWQRHAGVDSAGLPDWRQSFGASVVQVGGDAASSAARGDADGNGVISGNDFLAWQRALGATAGHAADANGDGRVDGRDLQGWRSHFGESLVVDGAGAATFVVDLLDGKLTNRRVQLSGAGSDDTLVIKNVGFARAITLTTNGPDEGWLRIATPAGSIDVMGASVGAIDLTGGDVQIAPHAGVTEEFLVTADNDGVAIAVNGRTGPELRHARRIVLQANAADADAARFAGTLTGDVRVDVIGGKSDASLVTATGTVVVADRFHQLHIGADLQVLGTKLTIAGTPDDDSWQVSAAPDAHLHATSAGRSVMLGGIESVMFDSGEGDDQFDVALDAYLPLVGGVSYQGGTGVNALTVGGAQLRDLKLRDSGHAGRLMAGGTAIEFTGVSRDWAAPPLAINSIAYSVDEAAAGAPFVAIPADVGPQNKVRELSFAIDELLGSADRAEFWLVNAANHNQVLLGGPNGAPLLTLSHTMAAYPADRANFVNSQLHVDVSSVATTANAALLVRLVDVDGVDLSHIDVRPLSGEFRSGLLAMELTGIEHAKHNMMFDAEWLAGSGDFVEFGLVALGADGKVDGVAPGDIGFAQVVADSAARQSLFLGTQGIGDLGQIELPMASRVAAYIVHTNAAATIAADHISIARGSTGQWTVGWEEAQSVFGGVGRRNFDDAVIRLTSHEACSPLLLAGEGKEDSGSETGAGSAVSDGCTVTLVEGDSFDVAWSAPITIPASGALTFSYSQLLFDTTDPDFVNDAFEVALVDNRGNSLVRTIDPGRDAFFNVTEGEGVLAANGVTVAGDVVTVGLGGLIPGDTATIIFRLVNNDDDRTTTVRIDTLELTSEAINAVAPGGAGVAERVEPVGNLTGAPVTSGSTTIPGDDVLSGLLPGEQAGENLAPPHPDDTLIDNSGTAIFSGADDLIDGSLFNLTVSANGVELVAAGETEFLPFIWVSNSGEGTVSKYDTRTGAEVARYRTGPESVAPWLSPSRTAVTGAGDVWVANRAHISAAHSQASMIKVLHEGFVDRNGNGIVDTSFDANNDGRISTDELKPWDANGDGQPDDERIAVNVQVGRARNNPASLQPGGIARAIAIDADDNVWVGLFGLNQYEAYNGESGALLSIVATPSTPYGAVVDAAGVLWSATRGGAVDRIDTSTRAALPSVSLGGDNYGITVGSNGIIWVTTYGTRELIGYNPATGTTHRTGLVGNGRGVGVDAEGAIYVATNGPDRMSKYVLQANGSLLAGGSVAVGSLASAAVVDADGYVWTTTYGDDRVWKIDPATMQVVPGWPRITGREPYNYSDMTGAVRATVTERTGTWTEIIDAGRRDAAWASLNVAATTPAPSLQRARVRSADERSALASAAWIDVATSGTLLGIRGRYLEVEVILESTDRAVDPTIESIAVQAIPAPLVTIATPDNGTLLSGDTTLLSGRALAGQAFGTDPTGRLNDIVSVTVDGIPVERFDAGGNYFSRVALRPGVNRFEVQATDRFGQIATETVAVFAGPPPSLVDFSQFADITGSFTGVYGRTSLNEDDARLHLNLAIRNEGAFDADAPLLIGVTNISDPSVSVLNPDGYTPDGIPYFNYTPVTPGGRLGPEELTLFPTVAFDVPNLSRFDYDLVFFGKLNRPPEITTLPDIEALAGRSYAYDVNAIDPDQDNVTFSLLSAPAGMSIHSSSGVVAWSPQTGDVGDYDIVVRAADGRGGVAEQRYTLSVIAAPPNRPPVIVSTPTTMAVPRRQEGETTYVYDVNAIDPDDDALLYSLVSGAFPAGMTIHSATGVIQWGPSLAQIGEHDVTVRVEDGRGGVAEQAYTIAVKGDPANLPPVFVSTPITEFQSLGPANNPQGDVSPQRLSYRTTGPATFSEIVSLTIPDDGGGEGTADIIFVVDESGSMAGEHAWLTQLIATIDSSLEALGVVDNRFGLVGFADTGRVLQAGPSSFMTAANFATAAGSLVTNRSGNEDGYRGLDFALDNYGFRTEAAKAVILVTDEHRTATDASLTFQTTAAALEAAGVYFALVGNANLADVNAAGALGVAGDGTAYLADGSGELLISTGGVFVDSEPVGNGTVANIKRDYVDLAWQLDGVTWNLNILRDGGQPAQVFSEVFVDVLADDIVRQLPIDVVASDPGVGFVNLTGVVSDVGPGETATFSIQFSGAAARTFDLTFVRPDTGAILGSIPVGINADYRYDALALDPDRDVLTYSIVSGPTGLIINPATGGLSWAATDDDVGVHPVTIRVVDGRGGVDEQSFDLMVRGRGTGSIAGGVFVDEGGAGGGGAANGPVLVLTPNGLPNNVAPAIAAAGFEVIVGRQAPNEIATRLAARPDIDQIWIWNDSSDRGGGSSSVPVDPALAFTTADLDALSLFNATHDEWIMDGLSWRTHATQSELNLTANEVIALANSGGGIVLGADNGPPSGPTNSITQHVNQVAAHFGFTLFVGTYSTPASIQREGGRLFNDPRPVNPAQLTSSTTSYSELPHGLQPNGIFLETAVFGSPSTVYPGFGASSPHLHEDTFGGQTYASVNHVLTTSIAGAGVDREGLANWVVYVDQNENGVRDPGERFTVTDSDGEYAFTGLAAGEFVVRQEPQAGWRPTAPTGGRHVVTLTVGAAVEDIDFGNVQVDIGNNTQPRFTSTPVTAATAGQGYRYDADAIDFESDPIVYTLAAGPDGMTINPTTGVVGWFPALAQLGVHDVLLRVTDAGGLSSVQAFTVEVTAPNTAPVFTSTPPDAARVGRPLLYQATAQDAEQNALVYTKVGGPDALTINASTGRLVWTPTAAGSVVVTLGVSDGRGGSATQTFTLNVTAAGPNSAPAINSTPRTTTRLGRVYLDMVEATDADADPLRYTLTEAPTGMTLGEFDGKLTWTPAPGDAALPHPVTISVSDDRGGVATQTFELRVIHTDDNSAPLIVTAARTAGRTDRLYSYDPAAFDADGDALLWSLDSAPLGMSVDPSTGSLRWLPTLMQAGDHAAVLRVVDSLGAASTQAFTIHVECVNGTPLITSTPLTTAVASAEYFYGVRATDPNGDPLEFSFGNAVPASVGMTIDAAGLIRWTPTAAHVGSHEIVIVVQDPDGAFATQRYTVVVEPALDGGGQPNRNRVPRIMSTPTFAAEVDAPYAYQIVAEDVDGDALVYEFANPNEIPAGLVLDRDTGLITWTPTLAQVGDAFVAVLVKDVHGAVASQAFSIAVRDNLAPEILSEPVDEVFAGAIYRYDVKARDPEGDPLTFTLESGPAGMTIDNLGRILWTVPRGGAAAEAVVVRVADDRGQWDEQEFTLDILQDTTAPRVTIFAQAGATFIASGGRVDVGSTVVLTVTATDNVGVETLTLFVNGTAVGLDANGQATVQAQLIGNVTALASATDAASNTGQAELIVQVVDPAAPNTPVITDPDLPPHPGVDPTDNTGPTVTITSPEFGATISSRTPLVGTIDDPEDNLWYWRVYVARADRVSLTAIDLNDSDYAVIAEGTTEIHGAEITKLDPTLLTNDPYAILVAAFDVNGRGYVEPALVNVEGAAKIGEFSLAFTDLSIPLAGLPIQITRVYDSREAPDEGDFGFGWSLGVQDARILEIAAVGQGGAFFPGNDSFIPGKTKVYLTNPAGQRIGFTYNIRNIVGSLFGAVAEPYFTPDPGVYDTLTIDETSVAVGGIVGALAGGINPDDYTLTTKDGLKYRYNQTAGLQKITDRSGNSTTFTEAGVFHSSGVSIDFIRDSRGRITQIVDPEGGVIRYEYDLAGDLVRVTNQVGVDSTYAYLVDPAHFLDEGFDDRGTRDFKVTYDDQNRFLAILDAMGNVIQQQDYDELASNRAIIRDANGKETHLLYDDRGNVLEETDPAGRTTYREYGDQRNPDLETRVVDRDGNVVERAYDARGNVTQIVERGPLTAPLATPVSTQFTYDTGNNVTSITNARGATTTFTYDARRNLNVVTNAAGNTSRFTYDGQGRRSTFTDFNGNTTQFVYNAPDCGCANPKEIIYADGTRQTFEYDQFGQVTRERYLEADGSLAEEMIRVYDGSGRLIEERNGEGNVRRMIYNGELLDWEVIVNPASLDALGRLTESPSTPVAQRRSRITDYDYDDNDRLIRQTDAEGGVVEFRYDPQGNRVLLRDPVGNITTWVYDDLNRVAEERDPFFNEGLTIDQALAARTAPSGGSTATNTPAAHVTLFDYDGEGNMIEEIDRNGRRREMEYDQADRLLEERWFAAGTNSLVEIISFSYDAIGNLFTAENFNSRLAYTYDTLNRVTSVNNADGDSTTPDVVLHYEYDAQGNVTKTFDRDGVTVESTYSGRNLLQTRKWYDAAIAVGEAPDVADARIDFAYNAASRQTLVNRYSDVLAQNRVGSTRTSYDLAGRTNVLRHQNAVDALLSQFDYGYDFGGLVTTEVRDHADDQFDQNILYGYDLVGQLVDAAFSGQADESFLYDANSNRIRSSSDGNVTNYTTGVANQLSSDGAFTYVYDGEGNQIKRKNIVTGETRTYQYDHRNRLIRVDDWSSDPGDPNSPVAGAVVTQSVEYKFDLFGRRIERSLDQDGAGAATKELQHFVYDRDNVWLDIGSGGNATMRYLFGNRMDSNLAQWRVSDGTLWNLTDKVGTLRDVTNSASDFVLQIDYSAFGTPLHSIAADFRYLFTSREYDLATRDYYYRSRIYNSTLGRFSSQDPRAFGAGDPNLFVYVNNAPSNGTDPTGQVSLAGFVRLAVLATTFAGGVLVATAGVIQHFAIVASEMVEWVNPITGVRERLPSWYESGPSDAYRHGLALCWLARGIGVTAAVWLGDQREGLSGFHNDVDRFNNRVGAALSRRSGDCGDLALEALENRELRWIDRVATGGGANG